MIRFGYAAQNVTLPATTNRTLRLASLADPERVRAVVWENMLSLETILRWNAERGIALFRIGSGLIPFASHPSFPYDWQAEHAEDLASIGELARSWNMRLSMHPGQFTQPGSPRPEVVERSMAELRYATRVMDLLGSPDPVVVVHMGGAFQDRPGAAARFVETLLPHADVLRYLALENDERIWTAADVTSAASALGIPAILDTLHHALNPGGLTLREAVDAVYPTWWTRPKFHLSSQDPAKRPGAHAYAVDERDLDVLLEALDGRDADVMVEAKGKDAALRLERSARI